MQPAFQGIDLFRCTTGQDFDPAVGQVQCATGYAETIGFRSRAGTKENALNLAGNENPLANRNAQGTILSNPPARSPGHSALSGPDELLAVLLVSNALNAISFALIAALLAA